MADKPNAQAGSEPQRERIDYEKIAAMVGQLAGAIWQKPSPPAITDDLMTLRADYQVAVDVVKLLTDIRFRCLVFVTAIVTIANALVPGTGDPAVRIALALVGFVATLGITIYELRNTELYEAAIHRARTLETRLGLVGSATDVDKAGVFGERPLYVDHDYWTALSAEEKKRLRDEKQVRLMRFWFVSIKHDHGLALIYGAALGGWVYLIANGVLSLPAPVGLRPMLVPVSISLVSGVIGLVAGVYSIAHLIYHDRHRLRPSAREAGRSSQNPPTASAIP